MFLDYGYYVGCNNYCNFKNMLIMYKNIFVIGGGESGVGVVVFVFVKGYNVFVLDSGKI